MSEKKEKYPEFRWYALSTQRKEELRVFLGNNYYVPVIQGMDGAPSLSKVIKMACDAVDEARRRMKEDPVAWNAWVNEQADLQDDSLTELNYRARLKESVAEWVHANESRLDLRDPLVPKIKTLRPQLAIMRLDFAAERRYKVRCYAHELTEDGNMTYRAKRSDTRVPTSLCEAIRERFGSEMDEDGNVKYRIGASTVAKDLLDMEWQLSRVLQNTVGPLANQGGSPNLHLS